MIKKIAVIGAGTMGHSIAESFAIYGYDVSLYDTNEKRIEGVVNEIKENLNLLALERFIEQSTVLKALNNIHYFSDLKEAVFDQDYVIEAAPE
ncbi:3-hydroxyacyl-CoA dehydrogenase NAD-binding domain-containing protein [Peribacillus frigoritolerans]|uniref:3-hydroxyacyl-CoA dehydrogenase NAD-binding domain-containing protein n=1 Tax=Peribacillus frigoritolerans TaxID=450367 RepID=UPI003F816D0D